VSSGTTLNVIFHLGSKQSTPVIAAQPDKVMPRELLALLEWYMTDSEHTVQRLVKTEKNNIYRNMITASFSIDVEKNQKNPMIDG